VVAAINAGLAIGYVGLVITAYTQDLSWRADFTAFYAGWTMVRQGLGTRLYDFDLQRTIQHVLLAGYPHGDGILAFYYPPHVALLFCPLSFLPLNYAYALWTAGQLGVLTWLCVMLWRQTLKAGWSGRELILLLSGMVALPSMMITLQLGTFSLLMLLCLVGLYDAVKRHNDFEAALWLVIGSIKPNVMILPAVALLFSRRWRVLGYGAAMMMFIIVISSVFLGRDVWYDFIASTFIAYDEGYLLGVLPLSMINLKGILTVLLAPEQMPLVNTISLVVFILAGFTTAIIWFEFALRKQQYDLLFGLTVLMGTLFGLHVNPQDGLFIVVPSYLLYNHLRSQSYLLRSYGIFLAFCPIMLLLYRYTLQSILGISAPSFLLLILLCWMVSCILKETQANPWSQV